MKILIVLITILPPNFIFAQMDCCELMERSKLKYKSFKTTFNADSTNYSLVVLDTISKKPIFEYDYKVQNPFLNLEYDYFNKERIWNFDNILGSFKILRRYNSETKKEPDIIKEDADLRRSKYNFKNFELDALDPLFKEKVHQFGFNVCTDSLNIYVRSNTIYLQENRLRAVVKDGITLEPYGYALVQNKTVLSSCTNILTERRLDVIKSNGQLYSIIEVYDQEERPEILKDMFKLSDRDFDIVELDSETLLICYIDERVSIYNLESERLAIVFDTKRKTEYEYEAIKVDGEVIVFMPTSLRFVSSYDLKKLKFKFIPRNGYSKVFRRIIVLDLRANKIYTKLYDIDKIKRIQNIESFNIFFENGKVDNIKELFEIHE